MHLTDKDYLEKKARKQHILVVSDHGGVKEIQAPVTSSVIIKSLSSSPTAVTIFINYFNNHIAYNHSNLYCYDH